jgi:hypothetical protein
MKTNDDILMENLYTQKVLNADEMGKNSTVHGVDDVSDEELLNQIAEKEKSVNSFMGAMLLSGLKAEAERRGLLNQNTTPFKTDSLSNMTYAKKGGPVDKTP